jgi:D-beta-D-heptose 7-phosphate kinase/D-beta-D-heptose 1-phosphate adenosyltransferase
MRHTLPAFENARILVAGDIMLDKYWEGPTLRISPEAPVPIVKIHANHDLPGAAGNVALNAAALGVNVNLLSITGDDALADIIQTHLEKNKIKVNFCKIKNAKTISKLRVISQHQQLIRLDFDEDFSKADPKKFIAEYKKLLKTADVVILSDYGKGALSAAPELIALARQKGLPVLVDPKGEDYSIYTGATILTPNRKEFETIVGKCQDEKDLVQKASKLIKKLKLEALLVTRGEAGMSLIQSNKPPLHLPARRQEVYDVTGAGDTVISVLASSLAAGTSLAEAVALSNLSAGIVVTKLGAATVSPHELRRAISEVHSMRRGILTEEETLQMVKDAHAHGETVVMTNGCFDLLHPGHIAYLNEAKKLADHLIVAVNDDSSVKKLKGHTRPINSLKHRMEVLTGLSAIDWVVPFTEETPERLINRILPDILVKGGDYKASEIAGGKAVIKNGGEVKILPFIDGYSSSNVIKKIKEEEGVA